MRSVSLPRRPQRAHSGAQAGWKNIYGGTARSGTPECECGPTKNRKEYPRARAQSVSDQRFRRWDNAREANCSAASAARKIATCNRGISRGIRRGHSKYSRPRSVDASGERRFLCRQGNSSRSLGTSRIALSIGQCELPRKGGVVLVSRVQ
jgi:hypothetical protein